MLETVEESGLDVGPAACDVNPKAREQENDGNLTKPSEHEDQPKGGVACKDCAQVFKHPKLLHKHELTHKTDTSYWCKLCMQNFSTHEEKVLHKKNVHPTKNKQRKCKLCPDKTFESEEEHLYHTTEVHKGKFDDFYMCSDCGKQFKTKTELTHHNNSKCGTVRQYKCQVCGQDLMTAGSLHNHMLRHNGERHSMCGYCGKTFLTAGQLKVHERSHTQEKAFVCDVCGKGFCHRQSLITHSTLHTGVKPYQCDNCGHSFSCVGNLIKHRRTHADTCGTIPLTTHRVNNPSTKMKVKMNTPKTSKLKMMKKEKELQEKLAAYKERLTQKTNTESTHSTDYFAYQTSDNKTNEDLSGLDSLEDCNGIPQLFHDVKLETEQFKETYVNNASDQMFGYNFPTEANYDPRQSNSCFNLDYPVEEKKSMVDNLNLKPEIRSHFLTDTNSEEVQTTDTGVFDDCSNGCDMNICDDTKAMMEAEKNKTEDKKDKTALSSVRKRKKAGVKENFRESCKYCSKVYTNANWLMKHEKQHEQALNQNETKQKSPYKCSCCKISFETREECKTHKQNMHADILTCQDCDKVFSNTDSLRSHHNIFHKGLPKKVYIYICDKCGLQFRQKVFLVHHEKSNCGSGPVYECHICGKGFSSVHTRRSHLRVHDPKKRFLCKFCGKSFRWKGQLKIHERSHTGEKPFKCLYCPKAFAYRESLMTHSCMHTGVKPHLCEACGSRFSCIGNLIKHRGTHAGCGAWYSKNQ